MNRWITLGARTLITAAKPSYSRRDVGPRPPSVPNTRAKDTSSPRTGCVGRATLPLSPTKVLFNRDAINRNESFNCIHIDKNGNRCKVIIGTEVREEIARLNDEYSRQPPDEVLDSGFECQYVLLSLCKKTKTVREGDRKGEKQPGGHLHTAGEETMAMLREKLEAYVAEWKTASRATVVKHHETAPIAPAHVKPDLITPATTPAPRREGPPTPTPTPSSPIDADLLAAKVARKVGSMHRADLADVRSKVDGGMALSRRTSHDLQTHDRRINIRFEAMEKVIAERSQKPTERSGESVWSYAVYVPAAFGIAIAVLLAYDRWLLHAVLRRVATDLGLYGSREIGN